jgi:hypothetical protein
MDITKLDEKTTASEFTDAARLYAEEAIPRIEEDVGLRLTVTADRKHRGLRGSSGGKPHKDSRIFYGTVS